MTSVHLKELWFETLLQIKRLGLAVFGLLLLFSAMFMLVGATMIYRGTLAWTQTKGKLTKFELHPLPNHPSHVLLGVGFQYSVLGADYQGQSLSALTIPGKLVKWRAASLRRHYHVGDLVNVLYNPLDPSQAYLERPDLFWDILLVPVSVGVLACWMLFLLVKTRRRKAPRHVVDQVASRFVDTETWAPVLQSVIERDHVVLCGTTTYSTIGGLFAGWPSSHVAILATPNEFAVIPGPFTKRGLSSSILTLIFELSLSRIWIPAGHGLLFLHEMWRRRSNWQRLNRGQYAQLCASMESIHLVSIDEAVIYGYEPSKHQLWYRLPGKLRDEFINLRDDDHAAMQELLAYVGIMQKSRQTETAVATS